MGIASGSIDLISSPEFWHVSSGIDLPEPSTEIHAKEIGCLSNADTFYRETSYRVLIPYNPDWLPRVLGHIRGSVGFSDPWDYIRSHLSVSYNLKSGFKLCLSEFCVIMS